MTINQKTYRAVAAMTTSQGMYRVVAGGSVLCSFWFRREAEEYAAKVIQNIGEVSLELLDWERDWQTIKIFGCPQNTKET